MDEEIHLEIFLEERRSSIALRSPLLLSAEKANAPRTNALLSTGWIRGQWTNSYYNCIIDISLNYKYYKPSMISRFSSTISSAMHCRPSKGLGRVFALFAFEGMYCFVGGKLQRESISEAIAGRLNIDQLIQSGRCKCLTAPT